MRIVTMLTVALALTGCPDDGSGRLPVDFGTDDDTSDVDGTGVDTDTEDGDTDPDTDSGTVGIASDCHGADPVDQTGWTRTYSTNYDGTEGIEIQTPGGLGVGISGTQAFLVNSIITPSGGEPISIVSYRSCNLGQLTWQGEHVTGNITGDLFGFPIPVEIDVEKRPAGDAPLLPPIAQMDAGTFFTYEYTQMDVNIAAQSQQGTAGIGDILSGGTPPNCKSDPALAENDAQCIDIAGEMTVDGPFNRVVSGTTWSAYMVTERRLETPAVDPNAPATDPGIQAILDLLGIGDIFGSLLGFGGSSEREILSVTFYVEGIGIVEQQVYDYTSIQNQSPENLVVTRELTSFTGL